MASPKALFPEGAFSCNEPECGRPAVYSAQVCRLHLADVLRREGEDISFRHPEWDGVWAAVIHLVGVALQEVPREALDGDGSTVDIDVYALVDGAIDRQSAHRVTDMLATQLTDTFGAISLQPPVEFEGDTLLVFRVPVPVRAAELIASFLQAAMRGLMIEVFGAQSLRTVEATAQTHRDSWALEVHNPRPSSAIRCNHMSHLSFALGKHLVQAHGWEFRRQIALPKLGDAHRALHDNQNGDFWAGHPHDPRKDSQSIR